MKAAVIEQYGPPEAVQIREVPTPVPGDDEILVRITATTVNSGDTRVRALRVPGGMGSLMRLSLGVGKPKQPILGFECAGEVDAVGSRVSRFKPGDRVVASHGFKFGLHAEYATFLESDAIVPIPAGVSDTDAVSVLFGGATSLAFFKDGDLKAGETILINGASGAVGTMAVQIAKHMGAVVTGVCSSANVDLVRGLGADHVIAYDREDFTKNGQTYDVIMDNHGNAPYARVKDSLKQGGRFLLVIFETLWEMVSAKWTKQVIESGKEADAVNVQTYGKLMGLVASGAIKPVIDRVFAFEQIAEAHRLVDSGRKRGSAIVTVP